MNNTQKKNYGFSGHITTDYFEFTCNKCGAFVENLEFSSEDSVGVKLSANCKNCKESFTFKIKVDRPLKPSF